MNDSGEPTVYEIRSQFRAPLPFVFRWCTDYTPSDPKLEKEKFTRRVLRKGGRTAVYEDLFDTPKGWMWSHQVVTLRPPNRWHADASGSHRFWSLDYELMALPEGGTELYLRGERRATPLGGKNPPRARLERELRTSWSNYGRALERDYRASRTRD
ncbi:MAG: hypothetical protein L3K16_08715 [Thermoplasmata archaeon]|nr:hypothetical protein [Thermoplasmata archaeon]